MSKFDQFVAISKSISDKFNNKYHFNEKTRIIYNLIDKNKCRPTKKLEKEKFDLELVSVGRLHPIKGFDRVLKAILKLKEEGLFENSVYKIVGDGPMRRQLEEFIKKNNLNDDIILYGSSNEPWNFLQNGDLFILSSYSEAFPTTVIESLLNHIPVFAVKYSSVNEMLSKNNSFIVENTDEAIYDGLKYIIKNKNKLFELKNNVKNYDYDNIKIKKQLLECLRCRDDE